MFFRYCDVSTLGCGQVFIEGPAVESVCYGNTIILTCSYQYGEWEEEVRIYK